MQKPQNQIDLYKYCPQCSCPLTLKKIEQEEIKECERCGFIFWNKPKPVVSMLIVLEGKILMLQRAKEPLKDYWCLPGGFVSYYETPEKGVLREVKEELGIEPIVIKIIGVYQIDNDPRGIHIDIIYYGETNEEPKASGEHQKFALFTPNNLPEKIAFKHREAILDWHTKGSQYG